MAPSKSPGPPGSRTPEHRPNLEEQLRAAGARPGSALEALIRQNQDFAILKGEPPRSDLPPWLRVYWRKAHPGSKGYPLAIHRIHAWLLNNQDHEKLRRSMSHN
jgi:hypothetical protein